MAETTAHLKTSGMHCSSCSMLIDMTLGDIDGVVESRTDHASGDTIVTFDDSATSTDVLIDAIREVGYDAEPVS